MDDALAGLLGSFYALKNPKTGNAIEFKVKKREHTFNYFLSRKGDLFCYTPHPDVDGNFWCFTYKPIGKGSRSGKAIQWKAIDLVRCAKRKTAKDKALARWSKSRMVMKEVM